jgi:hypothetical protein
MPDDNSSPDAPKSPFADLVKEIGDCPQAEAKQHLAEWRQRLDTIWPAETSNGDHWQLLVEQLPLPATAPKEANGKNFGTLLSLAPDDYRPLDAFLCDCGYMRLDLHYWTNHDADVSYRFVAGCVNLAAMPYRNSIRHFGCKTMMDKLLLGKICLVQI